ncbi:MAG: hypothetical protein WCB12_20605 [Bryobacteraceae bacterium]
MAALRSFLILGCVFGVLSAGFGQQAPSRPKKVLTPEQEALQQQMKQVGAERESLRAKAKEAFEQEMAREKAGDCPDAHNTYEFNMCYQKAIAVTEQNLKTYEEAIRDLLSLQYPNLTGQPPMPGVAGPVLTPSNWRRHSTVWRRPGTPISMRLARPLSISLVAAPVAPVQTWSANSG